MSRSLGLSSVAELVEAPYSPSTSSGAVFPLRGRLSAQGSSFRAGADLARRNGVDLINVTDQRLDQHLAVRGIRAQWLYNVGDITNTAGALTIPATLQFPFYKAGTWVRLTKDVITLDGIYDSTNIKTNTYTSLFTEEGIKVVNMCGTSYKVTIPLVATGATGAQSDSADNFPHPA